MAGSVAILRLILFVGASLLAVQVAAQGTNLAFGAKPQDTSQPVEANSDELYIDESTGTAVFTGNVVIIQGAMRLAANRVEVIYVQEREEIDRMEATGGVTIVSGNDAAEAGAAVYNLSDQTIVMTGDVLMTQGAQVLSGEKLVIRLDEGTANMSGRVRTVLQNGD